MNAGFDAAFGVALLGDDACVGEVRKVGFMAAASWRQRRDLRRACGEAEEAVRSALSRVEEQSPWADVAELNAAAERAWQGYLARRAEILTAEQVARLAVGTEHPGGHGGHQDR